VVRNADLGILHSLYNQAPKKVFLYEKQYMQNLAESIRLYGVREPGLVRKRDEGG
jgi:ParB-like chromosome segregation protein Spo0J